MQFRVIPKGQPLPQTGSDEVYLRVDHWNDYSFVTMFFLAYRDIAGELFELGQVKIGFKGQTTEQDTFKILPPVFFHLEEGFFSVGQDVDFYKKVTAIPGGKGKEILRQLRDLAVMPELLAEVSDESVLRISLLRSVSLPAITGQFSRILDGNVELTNYKFAFSRPSTDGYDKVDLDFQVVADSVPNTNIHAIIGRNGVGKTILLNSMIGALTGGAGASYFTDLESMFKSRIGLGYFSSLVSVSFSAFDPFIPPSEQSDPTKGTCYYYIGLKDPTDPDRLRPLSELRRDCSRALSECFSNQQKLVRWRRAIGKLDSDEVFVSMDLPKLLEKYNELEMRSSAGVVFEEFHSIVDPYLERMSSGHAVVLLTITRLVASVEEKTLVLLDEPESHLHPPLLSAFIRALADLLHDRNGVAIVATHSPVVLQEIPRSCVWKIYRVSKSIDVQRPKIETFAENVGLLTAEVFGLEVSQSGFHALLAQSVAKGPTYDEVVASYRNQIGFEGKAVLAALLSKAARNGDSA
ncbi:AAA family ATPase [Pseudoxanthomonas sp. CAU 1598]|uniref:AAA family ATPase n=2 Tax=Pseudomarimonas arenosa TaxID=2774145 RepID=A0AAW3ZGB4_9GAMM|nr:AAA family ATPase [Pseudomarimonas arenosa]